MKSKKWIGTLCGGKSSSWLLAASALAVTQLSFPATMRGSERIQNPKIGGIYQYNARLAAINPSGQTITVRGIADPHETLTLAVQPSTKLSRTGKRIAALEDGKVGEPISGTLTIASDGRIVALTAAYGTPLAPPRAAAANRILGAGLASAGRARDPLRGSTSSFATKNTLPTDR